MKSFKLTAENQDFSGGTVNVDGVAFDVQAALEEGDGVISTDDDIFAAVLQQYPALEACTVPTGATPIISPLQKAAMTAQVVPPQPWVPQGQALPSGPVVTEGTEIPAEHPTDTGNDEDPTVDPTGPSKPADKASSPVAPATLANLKSSGSSSQS